MKRFNMPTDVVGASIIIACLLLAVGQVFTSIANAKCQIEEQMCVDPSGHFERECP